MCYVAHLVFFLVLDRPSCFQGLNQSIFTANSYQATTKHTGCSRTHTHEHQSQAWRKALGTVCCAREEGRAGGCSGDGGTA